MLPEAKEKLWIPPLSQKDQRRINKQHKHLSKNLFVLTGLRQKTFWDILQLLAILAIPIVVAWYSADQNNAIAIANLRLNEAGLTINTSQQTINLETTQRQQVLQLEEADMQDYFNRISDLLLNNNLRTSNPGDEARSIARARTLTILPELNGFQKGDIIRFLYETNLIANDGDTIINLNGADLSTINLKGANLTNINLSGTNLTDADLSGANLSKANLSGANLTNTNLSGASLNNAIMSKASQPNIPSNSSKY